MLRTKLTIIFILAAVAIAACGSSQPERFSIAASPGYESSLFRQNCAICHGPDGSGGSTNAEDLSVVVPKLTDAEIVDRMTNGYLVMPPQQLEDQEMADVLSYLRQQWGGG